MCLHTIPPSGRVRAPPGTPARAPGGHLPHGMGYPGIMGGLVRELLLIIVGASLLVFHRPLAHWQQARWRDARFWPFSRMATPPLVSYIVPLVAVGLGFIVAGVLSLAGIGHWKN